MATLLSQVRVNANRRRTKDIQQSLLNYTNTTLYEYLRMFQKHLGAQTLARATDMYDVVQTYEDVLEIIDMLDKQVRVESTAGRVLHQEILERLRQDNPRPQDVRKIYDFLIMDLIRDRGGRVSSLIANV